MKRQKQTFYNVAPIYSALGAPEIALMDVASKAKVSLGTLYKVRRGEPVNIASLTKVAKALGITMAILFEGR